MKKAAPIRAVSYYHPKGGIFLPYAMYLRKSRADMDAEARGEGETLARHRAVLEQLAERLSLNVACVYQEIVSGESIAARPQMQQLLADVEAGRWEGVLVVEIERLARGNTIDQGIVAQAFKMASTKIITPTKTFDPENEFDEEYFEFGLFMSRREYKTINRRLQAGRKASATEGKYYGSRNPYGYERVKLQGQKGFTLKIVPEQAAAVRLMFDWYLNGYQKPDGTITPMGARRIAGKLQEMGFHPQLGGDWTPASVTDILKNPLYAGKICWKRRPTKKRTAGGTVVSTRSRTNESEMYEGLHEPIISEDTFRRVQEKRSQFPQATVKGDRVMKNPLCGLVVCGKCGKGMTRRPNETYPDMLICTNPKCKNVGSLLSAVEKQTISCLRTWLEQYKIESQKAMENNSSLQIDAKKESLKVLEKDIASCQTQLNKLHDLLEQGVYSPEMFKERYALLDNRLTQFRQQQETLQAEIEQDRKNLSKYLEFIPRAEQILDTYYSLETPAERNSVLREIVDHILYAKDEGGRYDKRNLYNFRLEVVPKIPK